MIVLAASGYALLRLWRDRRTLQEQVSTVEERLEQVQAQQTLSNNQLGMLCDVAHQFSDLTSSSESVNIALDTLWQLPQVDAVAIVLGENELGPFHYVGIRGVDAPFDHLGNECPLPLWGALAQALVHRPGNGELDHLVIHDIRAENKPTPEEFPWLPTTGSLVLIPLRGRSRTIGAVILHAGQPRAFSSLNDQRLLYALSGFVSRSLFECRTHDQYMRFARHLISLQTLTRTMTEADTTESIQRTLYDEFNDLFGEIAVHLFLRNQSALPQTSNFDLYAGPHISPNEEQFVRSPHLHQLLAWVIEAEQPLFVEPQASVLGPGDLYYTESGHGVLVPILETRGQAGGVLLLVTPDESEPFNEEDLIVIRTVANSASVAIGRGQPKSVSPSTPSPSTPV